MRVSENYQSVIGPPYLRFYAGAPLTTRSGANIGTLCLADTRPRDTFDLDDSAQLASLAKIVTIQMRQKIDKLSTCSEDRFDIHVRGTVSHYDLKPTDIDILNISNRGAMLRVVDITFARGDEVLISINTVAISATIAWSKEDLYGLTFHRPFDAHALEVSIGVQKGPPIGVQKRPPPSGSVTVTDAQREAFPGPRASCGA
jgi:hypothetical protein